MTAITGPLSTPNQKIVAEALQGALVDLLDLSLIAKQAHWNVVGPHFRSLHLQLDELVTIARDHADTVAERAVALGVNPDGRAATVAESTRLQQPELSWIEDSKVVTTFTDILENISERMRARIDATDQPDPVTQDLLIAVAQDIEKQHWMFQAQR